jgi:hypothetical protein
MSTFSPTGRLFAQRRTPALGFQLGLLASPAEVVLG